MEALEIPVLNRISGFEAGFNGLHNPSFLSRFSNLMGIEEIFLNYSLWTWGALILAIVATFSSLINRTKLVIFRFWGQQRTVDSEHLFVDDDDDDDTCSSASSDDEPDSPLENQRPFDEDFQVAGSGNYDEDQGQRLKLRRRFSWSDFASGKSVVKLWDGLGLGLKIEGSSDSKSVVSMWDLNNAEIISSFHGVGWCQIPAVSRAAAPPVVLMAGLEDSGNMALRIWDVRVDPQIPASLEEFQTRRRRIVGIDSGGVEKVYITDDSSSVTVRDMRKVGFTTLDSDGETWWDADAVIVPAGDREGCFEGDKELPSPVKLGGSVVSRCRDAVKSYLF